MRKSLLIIIICTLHSLSALSQSHKVDVEISVKNKDDLTALPNAIIVLINNKDSSRTTYGQTDNRGILIMSNLHPGIYALNITFLGFTPIYDTVTITRIDTTIKHKHYYMNRTGLTLNAIEISEVRLPMTSKGDTLEFNADYYRTRKNTVLDDLLKKMPGLQIAPDGSIKINGQSINRLLVNGNPFFGDDMKVAIQNLPSDAIEKIQIITGKIGQLQFGNIDNDNLEKTMNITIKKEKKNSLLGRLSAGYGTSNRFVGSGYGNWFGDEQQLSIVCNSNNVNNSGFLDNGTQEGNNGISRSSNIAANISRKINKRLKVDASYVMKDNHIENRQNITRQNLLPESNYLYNQSDISSNYNLQHTLSTGMEYSPDSLLLLSSRIRLIYRKEKSFNENKYESFSNDEKLVNNGYFRNYNSNILPNIGASFLAYKKFRKAGRSLNVSLQILHNRNTQRNVNMSTNEYAPKDSITHIDTINQRKYITDETVRLNLGFIYVEPLFKDRFLELSYAYNFADTKYRRRTYDFNVLQGLYNNFNDSLSENFTNNTNSQAVSIKIRTKKTKYTYSIGLNILTNRLENTRKAGYLQKQRSNILPFAFLKYRFLNNSQLTMLYSGSTQLPDVLQLFPLVDNSNPLYLRLGNPDLKPSLIHSINLGFNSISKNSKRNIFFNIDAILIRDKIITNTWLDSLGRQISQAVNRNGNYSITGRITSSIQLRKHLYINTSSFCDFNRDINYVNNIEGSINNFNFGQYISLNYMYRQTVELFLSTSLNFNKTAFSTSPGSNSNYLNNIISFNYNINLPLNLSIGGNLNYIINTGRSLGFNRKSSILNLFIAKTLFRSEGAVIKLQAFDLFNENTTITRNVTTNYVEDIQAKTLTRFFMFSFTLHLNNTKVHSVNTYMYKN